MAPKNLQLSETKEGKDCLLQKTQQRKLRCDGLVVSVLKYQNIGAWWHIYMSFASHAVDEGSKLGVANFYKIGLTKFQLDGCVGWEIMGGRYIKLCNIVVVL